MDEITNRLDETSLLKLYIRLEEEVTQNNKCIILTSHYSSGVRVEHYHRLVLKEQELHELRE